MKVIRELCRWKPTTTPDCIAYEVSEIENRSCRICTNYTRTGKLISCTFKDAEEGNVYHLSCVLYDVASKVYGDHQQMVEAFRKFLESEPEFGLEI
jgi:hypothetical protein